MISFLYQGNLRLCAAIGKVRVRSESFAPKSGGAATRKFDHLPQKPYFASMRSEILSYSDFETMCRVINSFGDP
jgi:hypothetical protein